MKTRLLLKRCSRSGNALFMVLIITVASVLIMAGTLNRTYTVARLNDRSYQLNVCQNAAEAAVEKVFARMQYDFQSGGGPAGVSGDLTRYRTNCPNEDAYWNNFQFSGGNGSNNAICVYQLGTYTGTLPQAYPGRITSGAPIYRIVANATLRNPDSSGSVIGTAQEDIMLALVPLTTYAIFYNGVLEFSTCATMTVTGPVHCNTNIFVGAGSGATLTFNGMVSASASISAPTNNGANWGNPYNFNTSNWRTYFDGTPTNYVTNVASVQLAIPMTNTHFIIDMPTNANWSTTAGAEQLYNQAQVILLVSNTTVSYIVQKAPTAGSVSAADPSPYVSPSYSTNVGVLITNLPFLSITNLFRDQRENTTNITTQIDVGQYSNWINTNVHILGPGGKFANSGNYPTLLYVADNRTAGAKQLAVVRLTNGIAPPANGGAGWSVATPNPLYVWGNYNQTNSAYLGTTNTSGGTVPCSFMSDAITILSSKFNDRVSLTNSFSSGSANWDAATATTVNAALVTGIVPSTGTDTMSFSGGVHNLTRLLEDWSSSTFWLNTSIVNLFNSTRATNKFVNPGTYYEPPTRKFTYDQNFSNPSKVPPGIPCALVALRYNWASPPPNTTNYNVTP